jgi:DNA-binding GntR family transcriptional regulator
VTTEDLAPGAARERLEHLTADAGVFTTKKAYVGNWLREQIVAGSISPGTRITQIDIAERLNVSMTPVREALLQLEAEGYLVREPHVGVRVADIPRDRVEEVFPLRMRLEGYVARLAAEQRTENDLLAMQELSRGLEKAVVGGDLAKARTLNYRFHLRVWESARNPIGLDLVNRLWAVFPADLLHHIHERRFKTLDEHAVLLHALEIGDPDAAETAMQDHILSGLEDHRRFNAVEAAQA